MKKIYFDNCLTSKTDEKVVTEMIPYFTEKFYFPENFVSIGTQASSDIDKSKKIIADSLNVDKSEIHFTTGGTSANNLAIKGFLTANSNKGTHIICSIVDYPDILTNASFFEKSGFEVTYLSADWDGRINLDELKAALRSDTVLFMTTLSNHTMGTIQDMPKIKEILSTADHHIYTHVDACEAYARMHIDPKEMGIDMMSISAHKIHGPQGIGALYLRKGINLGQIKHGIDRIDRYETGGISVALIAGFAKAVELAFDNLDEKIAYMRKLSNHLLQRIQNEIPHIIINGAIGEERICHNMNISFSFIEGEAITVMLDLMNINVATGSACASKGLKANYILMGTGRTHEQSHGSIKFTFSRFNTIEEVDYTVDKLKEIVQTLRERSPLYTDYKNQIKENKGE